MITHINSSGRRSALLLCLLFGPLLTFLSVSASAYDVEANSTGNKVYMLLLNDNPGAVYHSISISETLPTFVGSAEADIVPDTVLGGKSDLARVLFDVNPGASNGQTGDMVITVSGSAAGAAIDVVFTVPLEVVASAPAAQGFVGSTEPAPDPGGVDTDSDGVTDALETAYGSDPNSASSLPGEAPTLPSEVVPILPLPAYLLLAGLLSAASLLVRRRNAAAGQNLLSALLCLPFVISAALISIDAQAGAATRIQLVGAVSTVPQQLPATATASSTQSGGAGGPALAVDDDLSTRWESQHSLSTATLTLDLGSPIELNRVEIHWEAANAATYDVEGSSNGTNWTTLSSESGGTLGERTDTVQISGTYQYVRMKALTKSAGNNWGYSIFEMDVFGQVAINIDSDNDGVDDNYDLCPGTAAETPVESNGCPVDFIGGYDAPTSYPGYTLVWADEFSGTTLNTANWTHETGTGCPNLCGWGNNEQQYYRAENTTVANGWLTIEAKNEFYSDGSYSANYTSSRLKTQNKQSFQYGRIDFRAVLPQGMGPWPALWMLGDSISSVGWPESGEIDVMEKTGWEDDKVSGAVHWDNNGSYAGYGCEFNGGPPCASLSSGIFADEFHVFSIVWDANKIEWYLDGATTPYLVVDINPPELSEFKAPFFLLMNIAVGGSLGGTPNNAIFPQKMIVDYVRVYQ